jgi:large subunit ribosomal protein L9
MEIILRKTSRNWLRGQVVKVAAGYARNYLLPNRLAVAATESTRRSSSRSARASPARDQAQGEAEDLSN